MDAKKEPVDPPALWRETWEEFLAEMRRIALFGYTTADKQELIDLANEHIEYYSGLDPRAPASPRYYSNAEMLAMSHEELRRATKIIPNDNP